ncbi:MAG: hypothetical protein H0V79_04645 [Actinobacteria bacterium]|nr:hypothetical protein [Actinomycetota bacterium]
MHTKRLTSLIAGVVAALVLAPASVAAEAPASLSVEEAHMLFSGGSSVVETQGGTVKSPGRMQFEGGGGGTCWSRELERSEGWFPYGRRLFLYTIWCGSGGQITYRSSAVRTSHDFACWTTGGPYVAKTYGGAGFGLVEVQAWAEVACHSPTGWPTWHDTLMLRVQYHPNGHYATVAYD